MECICYTIIQIIKQLLSTVRNHHISIIVFQQFREAILGTATLVYSDSNSITVKLSKFDGRMAKGSFTNNRFRDK